MLRLAKKQIDILPNCRFFIAIVGKGSRREMFFSLCISRERFVVVKLSSGKVSLGKYTWTQKYPVFLLKLKRVSFSGFRCISLAVGAAFLRYWSLGCV